MNRLFSDDLNKIDNQVQLVELEDKEILVKVVNVVEINKLCNQLLCLLLKVCSLFYFLC
jgi:hypothetical protein